MKTLLIEAIPRSILGVPDSKLRTSCNSVNTVPLTPPGPPQPPMVFGFNTKSHRVVRAGTKYGSAFVSQDMWLKWQVDVQKRFECSSEESPCGSCLVGYLPGVRYYFSLRQCMPRLGMVDAFAQ